MLLGNGARVKPATGSSAIAVFVVDLTSGVRAVATIANTNMKMKK